MFFAKGVLAVPSLDWLAVILVEIETLCVRDVEMLRDTLVESGTMGMRDAQIVRDAPVLDTEREWNHPGVVKIGT